MSGLLARGAEQAPAPSRSDRLRDASRRLRPEHLVVGIAVVTGALRLPLVARPLSSDEGGFLMVAAQWHPGTSLYGDYWVDRPPLLITLFRLADLAGGAVPLRLLGIVAVVATVMLASRLGRIAVPAGRWAPVLCAATAAVFVSTPLFDPVLVNGELLAVPFVVGGLASVLIAARSGPSASGWWLVAGAAATAGAAVKQSMLEVFVAAAAAQLLLALRSRRVVRPGVPSRTSWRAESFVVAGPPAGVRVAAEGAVAFVAGSGVTAIALLLWARLHGTTATGLWDAVVTFRGQASAVLASSASSATSERASLLLVSLVVSGAPALAALAAVPCRDHRRPPTVVGPVAAAVLAWELFAVAAGGSYWLHYLVGTIPGLVLCAAVVATRSPARARWAGVVLTYAAVVAAAASATVLPGLVGPTPETAVEDYLADHARPGDTGVVAFGAPELLEASGLPSPYPQLWSLPVRASDPELVHFTRVLAGPERPTWVVVDGESVATWGVDATSAQQVLDRGYQLRDVIGDWHLYHVR